MKRDSVNAYAHMKRENLLPSLQLCAFWTTPCAFHFVEMQSVFCLYLQNGLEFFNQIL